MQKHDFENDFLKLRNIVVFEKTKENVRKYRDIQIATTEAIKNYLVSEPNYHTTKFFSEKLLSIEITKIQTFIQNTDSSYI